MCPTNQPHAIYRACDALLSVVDHLYPIEADMERVKVLLLRRTQRSARDAVQGAIRRHEIERILRTCYRGRKNGHEFWPILRAPARAG